MWLFPWEDVYSDEDVEGDSDVEVGPVAGVMFLSALKLEDYTDKWTGICPAGL